MAKIAMLVGQDFEDSEVSVPLERLREAGHEIVIVGARAGEELVGKRGRQKLTVEVKASGKDCSEYDALLIPGGYSPDKLRLDRGSVELAARFAEQDEKPLAAVCHGPQLLIEADAVRGKRMTSWPSVRRDLENAGASWVDAEVVEDKNLITSRKPDDLEAFCDALIARLAAVPGAKSG